MSAHVVARIPRENFTVRPMSQFNGIGALGMGDQATGD
jgi:hypothetical protein